jgi:hypothetical protein
MYDVPWHAGSLHDQYMIVLLVFELDAFMILSASNPLENAPRTFLHRSMLR